MKLNSTLSRAVLALVVAGASGAQIAYQFLHEKEGMRYVAYQDAGGIWTICMGRTAGVKKGDTATLEQCEAWAREDVSEAERIVDRLVTVPMSEPRRAAVISFCAYNIGPSKCAASTFLRKLNEGTDAGVCAEVRRWIFDRGQDCRDRKNNCFGQVIRREQEEELCGM